MGSGRSRMMMVWVMTCLLMRVAFGIRFVIDRHECLSHDVVYEGDIVHVSFVVIKADASWQHINHGIDLLVPLSLLSLLHFCFSNKSPFQETVDFDVLAGHYRNSEQHAKTEHFNPIVEHISKLEEALQNIQFEQHWLEAETERQALINESMSQRAVYKAIFESVALVGVSALQVFLLQRLFEQKLQTSRV